MNRKSITKEEINRLPLFVFDGTIVIIQSEDDAIIAINKLKEEKILGFDTETRASFQKGERYDVSLLQLATSEHAYLFRLNMFPIMSELTELLENADIVKTGMAVRDDIKTLQKRRPFVANNFIDLADMAMDREILNMGLRALTAIFLGKRLSKREKISNWDKPQLTESQIAYAACDAVVGFMIYQAMLR
ncbi:3'-5' exonuclease domain-containing protein 2 [Bacteriovoracaceae bacterium]|nr:3'-5' exonuclease domain-containing protein 2 [Bacteriovoracaceae bacterium]